MLGAIIGDGSAMPQLAFDHADIMRQLRSPLTQCFHKPIELPLDIYMCMPYFNFGSLSLLRHFTGRNRRVK